MSERPESEVTLEEDESEVSSINVQSFVDEQEWDLHSHVEGTVTTVLLLFFKKIEWISVIR